MITARESEVLKLIKENPLISQNELANILNISRASAATHIHNLTKKGYITGRGYILGEPDFVTVIAGINMDIIGISNEKLIDHNSNPGKIIFTLGGAGRNMALNLKKLDVVNYLISVYGNDINGEKFVNDSRENGLDIQHCKQIEGESTSTFLYLVEPNGHKKIGIDNMDIHNQITPDLLNKKIELINSSKYCIIDTNIPKETIEWLYDNCKVPIIVKTVSMNKNHKILEGIHNIHTLVISPEELNHLMEKITEDVAGIEANMDILLEKGVKNIIVFSSDTGELYFKNGKQSINIKEEIHCSANTNGASAALTAAVVWGFMNNLTWDEILKFSFAAAVNCMESEEPVNSDLSVSLLQRKIARK